jgi:YD repeat-containing protein
MIRHEGRQIMGHRFGVVMLCGLLGAAAFAADPAPPAASPATHPLKPAENGSNETVLGPYLYDGAANIKRIGRSLTEGGTQVSGQTGTDVYVYDKVNRLLSGSVRGGQGTQSYTYDAFGNRLSSSTSGVGCVFGPCEIAVAVEPLTNRLKTTGLAGSATYDASGNMKAAAAFALQTSRQLILSVPSDCKIHEGLSHFLDSNHANIVRYSE